MKLSSGGRPQPLISGILLVFCLQTISFNLFAQPDLAWAKSMGGTNQAEGDVIGVDGSGNIFTAGIFYFTVDFDPGPGVSNLTATNAAGGWQDIFITKFDAAGNFIWAKQLGGASYEFLKGMSVDPSGNLLLTGYFNGTADFDPGASTLNLTSAGAGSDIFIVKIDNAGGFVWANRIGGNSNDQSLAITTDPSGNVYTTGWYIGTVDFDPGAGNASLPNSGAFDAFVSKLDASGNFVWAKKFGGTSVEYGAAIIVDGGGNVITAGSFGGTVDFDPGIGVTTMTSGGSFDAFVCKLDVSGTLVWARQQIIGTSDGYPLSIGVDASDNIVTAGYFSGTADFDPGAATYTLTSTGFDDAFITKLDASGNFLWADDMGGNSTDHANSMAVTSAGEIFITGHFTNIADFDPGSSTTSLTSRGGYDIFVAKFNAGGALTWVEQMGGSNQDIGFALTLDGSANIITTGSFVGTSNFGPGTCQFNLTSTTAGQSDVFVMSLSQSVIPPPSISGFSPPTGPAGTVVTINGTNFSPTAENNLVFFSGVATTVTASTATSITTVVPTGTVLGPITVTIACRSGASATNFAPTGACYLPQIQRNALIDLYNSTNGLGWTDNTNWLSVDESTWHGVTVVGCRVSEIDLSSNQLNGTIPVTVGDLTTLQILKLNSNTVSGNLPVTIGRLAALKEINVQSNQLTGPIPAEMSSCASLEDLQLEGNRLDGAIPTFLGSLPNLKSINIAFNGFTGSIPSQLGNISGLTFLSLAGNSLTGSIPASLGNPTGLGLLDLSRNGLTGNIPPELGSLNALTSLQLWSNQLTGSIPVEIGDLSSLNYLNLSQNQLTGTVPSSLGSLAALKDLYLNDNILTGALPSSIGSLTMLTHTSLAQNAFTSIPAITSYDLHVENNLLDFSSLELSVPTTVNFSYSPQDLLPPGGNISFSVGGTLSIPFATPGTANSYQWYRGVNPVAGATSASLSLSGATIGDVGIYYVQVTSSVVTGLTLQSEPYVVTSGDPCASVTRAGGNIDLAFDPLIDVATTVKAVGVQSSGKILAATGPTTINGGPADGIVRFNADGSLDASFSTNALDPAQNHLIVQPDDMILTSYTYIPAYTPVRSITRLDVDVMLIQDLVSQ